MSSGKKRRTNPYKRISSYLIITGLTLLGASLLLFFVIFHSVLTQEFSYAVNKPNPNPQKIVPKDKQFGIVIPKIGANARVVANVDPFNEREYQVALTKGVAHARGTVYPGGIGNVFLFAHSSVNFYEANRYNSVFYLLNKMKKDDAIYLFYKGSEFKYKVTEVKIVNASDVKYLAGNGRDKAVTLMTCWPAGTTLQRLLVIGKISPLDKK